MPVVEAQHGHHFWWPVGFLSECPSQVFFTGVACEPWPSRPLVLLMLYNRTGTAHLLLAGMNNLLALPPKGQAAPWAARSGDSVLQSWVGAALLGIEVVAGPGPHLASPAAGYIAERLELVSHGRWCLPCSSWCQLRGSGP